MVVITLDNTRATGTSEFCLVRFQKVMLFYCWIVVALGLLQYLHLVSWLLFNFKWLFLTNVENGQKLAEGKYHAFDNMKWVVHYCHPSKLVPLDFNCKKTNIQIGFNLTQGQSFSPTLHLNNTNSHSHSDIVLLPRLYGIYNRTYIVLF